MRVLTFLLSLMTANMAAAGQITFVEVQGKQPREKAMEVDRLQVWPDGSKMCVVMVLIDHTRVTPQSQDGIWVPEKEMMITVDNAERYIDADTCRWK